MNHKIQPLEKIKEPDCNDLNFNENMWYPSTDVTIYERKLMGSLEVL